MRMWVAIEVEIERTKMDGFEEVVDEEGKVVNSKLEPFDALRREVYFLSFDGRVGGLQGRDRIDS